MSQPVHVAVREGEVIDAVVIDAATVELFRSLGFIEQVWPGCELVDVTDADPQPGIGWAYDGTTFTPPPPPPDPEDEPEPEGDPEPDPEPSGQPEAG